MIFSIIVVIPIYARFIHRFSSLHPIIKSSITLTIPNVLLIANILPFLTYALINEGFDSDLCIFSSFAGVASVFASNAGVVAVAYTTHSVLVKSAREMNVKVVVMIQAAGWSAGTALGEAKETEERDEGEGGRAKSEGTAYAQFDPSMFHLLISLSCCSNLSIHPFDSLISQHVSITSKGT